MLPIYIAKWYLISLEKDNAYQNLCNAAPLKNHVAFFILRKRN